MTNHYKISFTDPTTGKTTSAVIFRPGQPDPGEVATFVTANGIQTPDFWVPGSALLKVEYDATPDPVAEVAAEPPVADKV